MVKNIVTIHLTDDGFGSPFNIPPYTAFHSKSHVKNSPIFRWFWVNDSLVSHG